MTSDPIIVKIESVPKWWVGLAIRAVCIPGSLGLISDDLAERLAQFIGCHGYRIRLIAK